MKYYWGISLPFFRKVPLLRLLLPFILGLLVGNRSKDAVFLIYFTTILIWLVFLFVRIKRRRNYFYGIALQLCFFALGQSTMALYNLKLFPDFFGNRNADYYLINIIEHPDYSKPKVKIIAEVMGRFERNRFTTSKGNVVLWLKKTNDVLQLDKDDLVLCKGVVKPIDEMMMGKFDYKEYLSYHQIYHALNTSFASMKAIGNDGSWIGRMISFQRRNIVEILNRSMVDQSCSAIAIALLIGEDEGIDKSLLNAYRVSGTLHVLSVSGMHVGLIYFLLQHLLSPLYKKKRTKPFYFVIVMILIWSYSFLAGSSASIVRASTMLTCILMGEWMKVAYNTYSSLCLSIFVLLIYRPTYIYDTGFILSYLAVFGIVYLHPKIHGLLTVKGFLKEKIWELISISIAAQLITAPYTMYLFEQFPNLFLIGNLIVIPITTLSIYITILQVLCDKIGIIAKLLASSNQFILEMSNAFVRLLEKIPFAVTNNINLSVYCCLLLYLLLFTMIAWIENKNYRSLRNVLVIFMLFNFFYLWYIL